jgi:hypothetical protein
VGLPEIETLLHNAFPEKAVEGVIAPHVCEECDALRNQLQGTTWSYVPSEFVKSFEGSLPLLSQEAYVAFLPAWLLQAAKEPSEEVAAMVLVNLRHEPQTSGFSSAQAFAILEVARHIADTGFWGPDDPVNVESIAAIEAAWRPVAT